MDPTRKSTTVSSARSGSKPAGVTARATARIRQRVTPTNISETTTVPSSTAQRPSAQPTSQVQHRVPRVVWSDEISEGNAANNQPKARETQHQKISGAGGLRSTLRSTVVPKDSPSHNDTAADKFRVTTTDEPNRAIRHQYVQGSKVSDTVENDQSDPKVIESISTKGNHNVDDNLLAGVKSLSVDSGGRQNKDILETIEDQEKLFEKADLSHDNNLIFDETMVMLKSHYSGMTINQSTSHSSTLSHQMNQDDGGQSISCSGFSLGTTSEIFAMKILSRHNHFENLLSSEALRYGDRVSLSLTPDTQSDRHYTQLDQQHKANSSCSFFLGAKKIGIEGRKIPDDTKKFDFNVDLFPIDSHDIEYISTEYQWTVLRYRSGVPVRLGTDAVKQTYSFDGWNAPVLIGEPILLRHVMSGGILSCCAASEYDTADFNLRVLTDSFDLKRLDESIRNSSNQRIAAPTYLSSLQENNILNPLDEEIFYFVPYSAPSVPSWMTSSEEIVNCRRPYLDGSYVVCSNEKTIITEQMCNTNHSRYYDWQEQRSTMQNARDGQFQISMDQERVLVDEVIGSFLGSEGNFIRAIRTKNEGDRLYPIHFELRKFLVTDEINVDTILANLVGDLLELSTAFVRVRHFVVHHYPGYSHGRVMQAMCECIDHLLSEYLETVASKIDTQRSSLTLHSLLVSASDSTHKMRILEQACTSTYGLKGGALINVLSNLKLHLYRGDHIAERILQYLIDAASRPYIKILSQWMEQGELIDPYMEFMVAKVSQSMSEDNNQPALASWDGMYSVSDDQILIVFLGNKLLVEQILATGRNWNAIRTYAVNSSSNGNHVPDSKIEPSFSISTSSSIITSYVQNLYRTSSRELMHLLLVKFDLMSSLRLMKRYFLLENGDFFVNFLDMAEVELQKDLSQVSRGRVQHWLDVSVQLTERNPELSEILLRIPPGVRLDVANESNLVRKHLMSPAKLRCRFATVGLTEYLDHLHASNGGIDSTEPWTPLRHTYSIGKSDVSDIGEGLSGLEAFVLEFAFIPYPISLVLSPQALAGYQLLFRHLFFAKHVERRLVSIWQDHQFMKELQSLRGTLGPTFLLRQRMLHFLQNLIYYMMFEVIEPNWIDMEESISCFNTTANQNMDDLLRIHAKFLQRALDACLLTNRELVRALTKLMRTCLLFAEQMKRFLKATKIEDDRNTVADELQKVAQRSLNDRRIGVDSADADLGSKSRLHASMSKARVERKQRVHRQTIRVQREVNGVSYQRMVQRFDEVFSDNLREFMALLTHSDDSFQTHKVNLCIRLDYNGYLGRTSH